ncbi:MAG: aminotransferase class III-fold pyridoxal phosphate-dependent enzyme, partial [Pseudomonadota bacterium]|nr:aminotransferase class III-fold pyridoxal phosphate-dependent enzyme [Pseudomonadota bacterium]
EHPLVGNSRGAGLIGAVELVADRETGKKFDGAHGVGAFCMDQCLEHGLIVRALGDTIAFCPPLIIDDKQIDELFGKFDQALADTLAYVNKLD